MNAPARTAPTAAEHFLTQAERQRVKAAVAEAERATSGELRVHLEDLCPEDLMDRAAFLFGQLGMHRTAERNGVLLYLSTADRRMAVIGDAGIHAVVPPDFWRDVLAVLRLHLAAGRNADGLCEAARMVGEKLKGHFPHRHDDRNELPDDISFG